MVVAVTFAETAILFPNTSETTGFPAFVHWLHNPINSGIFSDRFVAWIHQNNFIVLVNAILVDPIRIQDPEVPTSPANSFFCSAAQASLILQVVDALADRFAIGGAFGNRFFAVSTPDADTVNDVALLGLVAQTARFVRT